MIRTLTLVLSWFFVVPAQASTDLSQLETALTDFRDAIQSLIAKCPIPTYQSRIGD